MVSQNTTSSGKRISSVRKVFDIIEMLSKHEEIGVSALAKKLSMPVSTVHAYLKTLTEHGYVITEGGKYRLSLRFLEIGGRLQNRQAVFQAAQKEMIDLCQQTGETVGLGVMENGQRVELWQIEGKKAINDNIYIGHHTHPHWTTLGKALLAGRTNEEIKQIVSRHGLPKATENTITEIDQLFSEIEEIRQQGYSIGNEEKSIGLRGVSVPIKGNDNQTIAALGINAPKNKLTPSTCKQYINMLEQKANIISIKVSY